MAEYTPAYMRTGAFDKETAKKEFEQVEKDAEAARSQVPQTRGGTKRPKEPRAQKGASAETVPDQYVAEGASAKTVPKDYVADLNKFSEKLYTELQMAYENLDKNEKVHLPDETVALHELIVRDTETYYEEVMYYLENYQVPGKVAKGLKRRAKGFKKKSEKRSVKYATDTQTRNWSASPPQAFSDFKQIYVVFYKHLIDSHLKATPEAQKAERERAHVQKGNKLTAFFQKYPALSKRRPEKEPKP
jgi:hypothetical protein